MQPKKIGEIKLVDKIFKLLQYNQKYKQNNEEVWVYDQHRRRKNEQTKLIDTNSSRKPAMQLKLDFFFFWALSVKYGQGDK